MASRRVTSSRPCRCLRCRQGRWGSRRIPSSHRCTAVRYQSAKSFQHEMDSVRRELEVLIEDSTISDLTKRNHEFFDIIELHVHEANEMLANVKTHVKASDALYEKIQRNDESIQVELSINPQLRESVATINNDISQLETNFHKEKKAALERCQQSIKEKYQREIDELQHHLNNTKSAIDKRYILQAEIVNSRPEQETQLGTAHMGQVEIILKEATEYMQKEKIEWTCYKRREMEKEQVEFKNSLRQKVESELKENSQRELELRMSEARLACLEEQKLTRQGKIEQILADAKKLWQEEHE